MASIYDITLSSATLLEEYQSKGYDDLLSALKLADERIIAQIAKTNGIYTKKKLQEIKKLIDAEIAKSYGGVFASVADESVAVASINYNAVLGYASMYSAIPEAAVKDLLSSTRQIQGYEFEELFKLSEANHARQLKVTIAAGMANNLTAQQLIREYNIKSNKLSKGQIKSNIFTVMTDSKNQGNYNAFEDLEKRGLIKYYEHISVLDGRTSPICQAHDGRKYYKDLKDIKGINKPPLHFNCRSQLLPRTTEDKQLRTSQDGIIPDEKYPEWFKRQPDTFQKSVLGPKKYKLYKSGDYKIESLPDVLSGKKRSLKQYQKDVLALNKKTKVPDIDFGYGGKFNGYVKDIRDEAKIVIDKLPKPKNIIVDKIANFTRQTNTIKTYKDDQITFMHEYGHSLDNKLSGYFIEDKFIPEPEKYLSTNRLLKSSLKDSDLLDIDNVSKLKEYRDTYTFEEAVYFKSGKNKGKIKGYAVKAKEQHYELITDIMDSLSDGYFQDKYYVPGHGKRYYATNLKKQTENFANLFALWSDEKNWIEAKKLFPNMTKEFELIMKEVIDGKFD